MKFIRPSNMPNEIYDVTDPEHAVRLAIGTSEKTAELIVSRLQNYERLVAALELSLSKSGKLTEVERVYLESVIAGE